MKPISIAKILRLACAGLALCQALQAAELLNGNFDSGKTGWSGSFNAGNEGGNGWNSGYFADGFPTNNTFASTVESTLKQNLSGSANTFVAGTTYSVSMAIFGSSNYSTGTANLWSLGFTSDGELVATDHWFSEEFSASIVSAGNGGTIPDDHIITVANGITGFKIVTFTYTATAADDGKVIGIQLGGKTQSKYTLAAGAPTPGSRYAMMDTITFAVVGLPTVSTFTSDVLVIDGSPITLSWDVVDPNNLTTLTLNDGSGPVNVLANTDKGTGHGEKQVNPTRTTIYTLTSNGGSSRSLTIRDSVINSFTANTTLATGPDYQANLSWSVQPGSPASVTISDGTTTTDVTADTSDGYGSRSFTVPFASTTFTLNVNNGSATKTVRVLRATASKPDKFWLTADAFYAGEIPTVSWKDSGNAAESWVGIYKRSDMPGVQNSTSWQYISGHGGATGSYAFGGLAPGEYYAVLFTDGGYTIEQGPVYFTVSAQPLAPFAVSSATRDGDIFTITWNSEPGAIYDVYASSDLEHWNLIENDKSSDGSSTSIAEDLSILPGGVPAKRYYRVAK